MELREKEINEKLGIIKRKTDNMDRNNERNVRKMNGWEELNINNKKRKTKHNK